MKPIVATSGDSVCIHEGALTINGRPFGAVLTEDHEGRPLPRDDFCGVLRAGEIYVASAIPGSFDSRTFGRINVHNIQARVVPLWTY